MKDIKKQQLTGANKMNWNISKHKNVKQNNLKQSKKVSHFDKP